MENARPDTMDRALLKFDINLLLQATVVTIQSCKGDTEAILV